MSFEGFLNEERPGVLRFGGARMALLDIESGFWGLRRQLEALVGARLTDSVLQQAGANGGASFAQAFVGTSSSEDGERALRDCIAAYQAAGFGQFEVAELEWPIGRVSIRAQHTFESWMVRKHERGDGAACAYTAGVLVGFVNALTGRRDIVCVERACQAAGAGHCRFELLPADVAGDAPVVAMDPDPGLGRQANLLETLFERMPMGIAIFDQDYVLRRYNPTWAGFADRYRPPSARDIAPGVYYFDFLPGTEPTVLPLFERALNGETLRLESVRLESEGIVTYWDVVLAPILENGEVSGILNVTIDATERVKAHQELEDALDRLQQREERLARVMEGINDGIWDWNLETGEVYFSPRWKSMLGYGENEIENRYESWQKLLHPEDLERASAAIEDHLQGQADLYYLEHRLLHKDGEYRWILARGQAVRDEEGKAYRLVGSHSDITEQKEAEEALHAAYQTLEQRVEERTRALATLLDVSHNLASTLELGLLLDLVLDQLRTVVDYTGASILTLDDDRLAVRAYRGPIEQDQVLALRFSLEDAPANREVVRQREPVIISDVRSDTPRARLFQDGAGEDLDTTFGYVRSWLGVPLMVKDEVIGMLTLDHHEADFYGRQQAGLVHALANQVAVAIENARLYRGEQERLEESERRRQVAEGLRGVLATLNSDRPLDDILGHIVGQARQLMGCQAAVVYQLALEEGLINIEVASGMPEAFQRLDAMPYVDTEPNRATISGRTFAIEDVQGRWAQLDLDLAEADPRVQEWVSIVGQHFCSYLSSPIVVGDQVYGAISLFYETPRTFANEELELTASFADQAALAIENARLRAQAEEAAVAAERNRLARDLHDAVTQTLFSSSLIAEVLPRLWERNPEEGQRRLARNRMVLIMVLA